MQDFRNIAVIAHVDHGKTTLVDELLKQSGTFTAHQKVEERAMDSNDLEKERGITILSKNTAIRYKDTKINIIDTPGHADFGGEVERVLKMVDGVLLLVDAQEGVMPQTKFVVKKALSLGLCPIVVVNKIDKPAADPDRVVDEVFDLLVALGANEDQLEFPIVYAAARDGYAKYNMSDENKNLEPLFETIIKHVPAPSGSVDNPLQLQVFTLDYDNYVGKIGIARIFNGTIKKNETVLLAKADGEQVRGRVSKLIGFTVWIELILTKQKVVTSLPLQVLRHLTWVIALLIQVTQCHLTHYTLKNQPFLLFSRLTILLLLDLMVSMLLQTKLLSV